MENNDAIVYAEVDEILNSLNENDLKKIPEKIRATFKQEKSNNYIPQIDLNKPLEEQNFKRKTFVWLSILYRDYLCEDEEEKKQLQKTFEENEIKKEKIAREKYNTENLFKTKESTIKNNTMMIEYKEDGFFKKIWIKIIKLLKKINTNK
mgnify:CR=1 FL=1